MHIFDDNIQNMARALTLRSTNQQVIASNIANIDTPGYTARKLDFDASLQAAIEQVDATPIIEDSAEPALSLDGNNVDLEGELARMDRNKMMYRVTAQLLAAKLKQLNAATQEGSV